MSKSQPGTYEEGSTITEVRVQKPRMYKVLLLNDDFTPMDFVVEVLTTIFQKSEVDAIEVMMNVHQKGFGVAGLFQYDIAETKVHLVHLAAKKKDYPLKCTVEPE